MMVTGFTERRLVNKLCFAQNISLFCLLFYSNKVKFVLSNNFAIMPMNINKKLNVSSMNEFSICCVLEIRCVQFFSFRDHEIYIFKKSQL